MLRLNRNIDNIRDDFHERKKAYYSIQENSPVKKTIID